MKCCILKSDLIIESNGSIILIRAGTLLKEEYPDQIITRSMELDIGKELLSDLQNWLNASKPKYNNREWRYILEIIQPAIDAINDENVMKLRSFTEKLGKAVETVSRTNPKAAKIFDNVFDIYFRLLRKAEQIFKI